MPRPKCNYKTGPCPKSLCYKPTNGASDKTESTTLGRDEIEALRLKDVKQMDQTSAAHQMGISQSSFQRILTSARQKISKALFKGQTINIDKK